MRGWSGLRAVTRLARLAVTSRGSRRRTWREWREWREHVAWYEAATTVGVVAAAASRCARGVRWRAADAPPGVFTPSVATLSASLYRRRASALLSVLLSS
ncbi:unnamed protein product [Lampetra fluviatilis]